MDSILSRLAALVAAAPHLASRSAQVPWFSLGTTLLAVLLVGAVGERDGRHRGNANRALAGFESGVKFYKLLLPHTNFQRRLDFLPKAI